jgi:hypothetical protein
VIYGCYSISVDVPFEWTEGDPKRPKLETCFHPAHATAAAAGCKGMAALGSSFMWLNDIVLAYHDSQTRGEAKRGDEEIYRDLTREARVIGTTLVFCSDFVHGPHNSFTLLGSSYLDNSKCVILIIIRR